VTAPDIPKAISHPTAHYCRRGAVRGSLDCDARIALTDAGPRSVSDVVQELGTSDTNAVIRIEGTATRVPGHPYADQVPDYAAKYTERIGAIFGTAERFAQAFSEAIVITPTRLHA
jgi:hypothetical protein